jgi:hypothetical protein
LVLAMPFPTYITSQLSQKASPRKPIGGAFDRPNRPLLKTKTDSYSGWANLLPGASPVARTALRCRQIDRLVSSAPTNRNSTNIMVAPSHANKRFAEFAAHFQVEAHDDVLVLSSTPSTTDMAPDREWSGTAHHQANSPVFNTCLAIIATSSAILALHLISRQYFEEKNHSSRTRLEEKRAVAATVHANREMTSMPSNLREEEQEQKICSTCRDPPDLIQEQRRDPITTLTTTDMAPTRTIEQLPRYGSDGSDLHPRFLAAGTYRPLKARVQEIVEISNGIDGLSKSTALDVTVRLAQMQSNEHMRLMELAFRQNTRSQQADQKERHHRETMDEQGKEKKWRHRLDSRFRDTFVELLSSTTTLATVLTLTVLCNYFGAVWNEFKVDPFAYTAGLICDRVATETTSSRTPTSIWFVGTWAYEYMQSTKTEMNCGLSIAQCLAAIVLLIGIQSFLPGMMGKVFQHACVAGALAKLSIRLLELEAMIRGAAVVAAFFVLFGGGIICYKIRTNNYFIRQRKLPTILEMDAVEDVLDQARLGFVFTKVVAALFLISRAACIYWAKAA